jgi:hypothetical protein
MVVIVQCPYTREAGYNPACGYYQMIEDQECGKEVQCLLCRRPLRVGPREQFAAAAPGPAQAHRESGRK